MIFDGTKSRCMMKKSPLPVQNICGTPKNICSKEDLVKILRWHFGHSEFRGKQLEAIEAVLSGKVVSVQGMLMIYYCVFLKF